MARDFTLTKYRAFLETAIQQGYVLTSYEDYLHQQQPKVLILRHDVDDLPIRSLHTAQLQHELGVKGTYYFRVVPQSYHPEIIKKIADLGHEIGYHYEDVALCKGNMTKALAHFEQHLEKFRQFYSVKTICMHGSPLSKWDNRLLWEHYDYKQYGILAEPYFDLDQTQFHYLTDTGRRWDGGAVSVRDKMPTNYKKRLHSTDDIIAALRTNDLPPKLMQNIHPQRWTNDTISWWKELLVQQVKNVLKRGMIEYRTLNRE